MKTPSGNFLFRSRPRAFRQGVLAAALFLQAAACGTSDAPAPDCPPLGVGTHHQGLIDRDETWRAEDGPHFVDGPIAVTALATLRVEACAVVRLAAGAGIEVGAPDGGEVGTLIARGDARRPIVFQRADAAPWSALVVHAPSSVELSHARLEGGGSSEFVDNASLVALGLGTLPAAPALFVDEVEVRGSKGHGVVLGRAARFAAGSRALRISDSGDALHAEPLVVGWHGLVDLPEGTYRGNANDEILVVDDNANALAGLQVDTVLHDLGLPYRIGRAPGDDLRVGASGGAAATLTLEAGTVLRFQPGGQLRVVSDDEQARGTLVVRGTAERPVRLTGVSAGSGAWSGLYFESPMAEHDVEHLRVEAAGGECACTLTSCSPLDSSNAAVIFDGLPRRAFMRHTTIIDSAGHGFLRSWLDHQDLDFLADNEVLGAVGCPQTTPELSDQVCPDSAFSCRSR